MDNNTELLNYARQERNLFVELLRRNQAFLSANQTSIENFVIAFDNLRNEIAEAAELKKFAEAVQKMRDAQKVYFKTRAPQFLETSRANEKVVDEEIKGILKKEKVQAKQVELDF